MSDTTEEVITKEDIAQFIKHTSEPDGELSAYERAAVSMAWSIWDSIGEEDHDHDLSEEEADRILSQFPLAQEEPLDLDK